MGEVVFFAYK